MGAENESASKDLSLEDEQSEEVAGGLKRLQRLDEEDVEPRDVVRKRAALD